MEKYIPDLYQENIFKIDYQMLQERGIKFIIFDLDNTIALTCDKHATKEAIALFEKLKKDFKIIIASNSLSVRVKVFAGELGVEYISNCHKPKAKNLKEYIRNLPYKQSEIAMIGDSMMDDIVCGNQMGITTILTEQLGKKEYIFARIRRMKERKIQKKLRDKNLFTKGRFYV